MTRIPSIQRLREFLVRDRRGVAAVEFAFIAPILLSLYFLSMEVSQAVDVNKKVGRAGSMVGDLITQQQTLITPTDLDAIMRIGDALIQPYGRSNLGLNITAITISNEAKPKATVLWSRKMVNGAFSQATTKGTAVTVPASLLVADSFLIRVDSSLDYRPVLFYAADGKPTLGLSAMFDRINMNEHYYMRPRMSKDIKCDSC